MQPLFTIITVTYNAEHTIERTLESVAKQTCSDYEHLIIDGKSTDRTMLIVKSFANPKIKYTSGQDKGIYDAMNKGLTMAAGKYIIFLNSGDKFHSTESLKHYAEAIEKHNWPGILYGETVLVDDDGNYLGPRHLQAPKQLTLQSFAEGMVVCHQAMAVNAKIAVLYNLKYKYSSDYEWCIISLQHSRNNVYLDEVTIDYLSEGMTTSHHRQSLNERFRIMCKYYGVLPTLVRHIKFAGRYLKRRKSAANIQ